MCEEHQLEFKNCSNRETLYECKNCPYYEFQYVECDGL